MPTYYHTCACFNCRKSFKKSIRAMQKLHIKQPICPECGGYMYVLGRKFTTPAKNNIMQWKKIEILLRAGFQVGGHGYTIDQYPEKLDQVPDFIRNNWFNRCDACIALAHERFGSCPRNSEEIENFIKQYF